MTGPAAAKKPPLYWRLLRLRYIRPNGWQRALLVEGVFTVAAVLTLADVSTAWTLVVLPLVAAGVTKLHDVLAGLLGAPPRPMTVEQPDANLGERLAPYESTVQILPANMAAKKASEAGDPVHEN